MCGIVGYIGNNAVADVLLDGLKSLEYRGYDSSGIALNDNAGFDVFKAGGKLNNLFDVIRNDAQKIKNPTSGIGHIRWATHGKATIDNAHPHLSNDGKLVLVHNGIIENYKELKAELEQEGFVFHSQTDTETAVHVIDREYKKCGSWEEAVRRGVQKLSGAFAFCIMHKDEADKIIAVRKNAPLIIGLSENENYIASDIPAVIGISQSGETADTITAVKQAKEKGAKILIVTNREDSSIVRYADSVLPLEAGIEISVAATKSYTAQLLAMYWVGLYAAEQRNSLSAKNLADLKQGLLELPAKMEEVLSNAEKIKQVAENLNKYKSLIYIARGANQASALEGALKLKEISYINANGYAAGELKHGPIALLDENMPVVAVLAPGITYAKMLSNCEDVKARNAKLIAVTSVKDKAAESLFEYILPVPETEEHLSPLLLNIPMQLLAYYMADSLGREVDQPRNLAKSVTVE